MGKGDRKNAKGKRVLGTYGNLRKRKKITSSPLAATTQKKQTAAPKTTVKNADTRSETQKKE